MKKESDSGSTPATVLSERRAEVDRFADSLSSRLSPRTVASYRRDVVALMKVLPDSRTEEITESILRRAVARLHAQGLSGRSLARHLSAWRSFFEWRAPEGARPSANPCRDIRPPKSPKRLPNALTVDEASQLFTPRTSDNITGLQQFLHLRDQAMFELLYGCGLRVSELAGLSIADIDVSERVVRVTGKGDKTRLIPFGTKALEALTAWNTVRQKFPSIERPRRSVAEAAQNKNPAVFVTQSGARVSVRSVQSRLAALGVAQGIASRLHPHRLRHSFASHLLQGSGDLRAVQELMGHASLASTQVYTHLDFQHLSKVYDSAHPRSKRLKV